MAAGNNGTGARTTQPHPLMASPPSGGDGASSGGDDGPVIPIPGNDAGMVPASNRVDINMGVTPWKFLISSDPKGAQAPTFDDSAWAQVGIPHTWNDADTFVNGESGGGTMVGGTNWYRKHFTLDAAYSARKIFVEFEGVHLGTQVYVNGTFMPGNISVPADSQATHVVGFIPFLLDVTKLVQFGGADNVIAVRVDMNGGGAAADGTTLQAGAWFENPTFSEVFRFGQADGGIFRPVWMHITDPVHIPQNVYATLHTWGTYVGTTAIGAVTAGTAASATIKIQTNVQNEGPTDENVTVTTEVVDATGKIVATNAMTQMIPAGGAPLDGSTASAPVLFEQTATVAPATLWYPNNSPYGKPYMYRVWHIVQVNGAVVDAVQSPLGIRTITWNTNLPIINGQPTYLQGAAGRYDYPALGTAVPEEQQWRDLQLLAAAGGNLWRPGHSTSSPEFVNAADAIGVMIVQPSGEGEGAFSANALATPPNYPAPLPADIAMAPQGRDAPRHRSSATVAIRRITIGLGGRQRSDRHDLRAAAAGGRQPVGCHRAARPGGPDSEPQQRPRPRVHAGRLRDRREESVPEQPGLGRGVLGPAVGAVRLRLPDRLRGRVSRQLAAEPEQQRVGCRAVVPVGDAR